ncbi:unnamed protein product [Camellia sinensis]
MEIKEKRLFMIFILGEYSCKNVNRAYFLVSQRKVKYIRENSDWFIISNQKVASFSCYLWSLIFNFWFAKACIKCKYKNNLEI